jgi:hypothetical protein
LAHPLGAAWLLAAAIYLGIAEVTPRRFHALPVCAAVALLFVVSLYLHSHYRVEGPFTSALFNLMFYNGLDQLVFTKRYVIPVALLAMFIFAVTAGEIIKSKSIRRLLVEAALPLELCVIVQAAILLLPNSIWLPKYPAAISALTTRGTLVSAVLLCALLGAIRPRKWHSPVLAVISAIFFLFLYQDTGALSRFEDKADRLVHSIPAGQRVIATIGGPNSYRFSLKHLADVSCVGHCFSYGNYEAPSGQFRVHASPGNAFEVPHITDATLMEEGRYVVQPGDLPLYQLYQCAEQWTELCIRRLEAGETNDRYGVHPGRQAAQMKEPSATQ